MDNAKPNNDKAISIIIVTYNATDTLQACLNSIYRQTYPNLQIIIMDGASVDGTVDILKANNSRITFWKSEPDKGIYYAMNKALDHVTGNWVYFIGADDELLADFSEIATRLNKPDCIYYGNVLVKGEKNGGPTNALTHTMHNICQQAMIYPTSVFKKYRYDTTYSIAADYVLNIRCWADKSLSFCYEDLTIAKYNHTGISSVIKDKRFEKDRMKLIFRYSGFKMWRKHLTRRWKEKIKARKI